VIPSDCLRDHRLLRCCTSFGTAASRQRRTTDGHPTPTLPLLSPSSPQRVNPAMAIQPVDVSTPALEPLQLHAILGYLGLLPPASTASADAGSTAAAPPPLALPSAPLHFLATHIGALPPNLAAYFGPVVTPQARSGIPTIRNRRLQWALAGPPALSAYSARDRHPLLYERIVGNEVELPSRPPGAAAEDAEDAWGQNRAVLGGRAQHGNLGALLQSFEDEREGERRRDRKREERLRENEVTEEYDSESEDDNDEADRPQDDGGQVGPDEDLSGKERMEAFERLVREKWIDGHEVRLACISDDRRVYADRHTLDVSQSLPYDVIDFDESLDPPVSQSLSEDRWFDDEPEESASSEPLSTSVLAEGEYDY